MAKHLSRYLALTFFRTYIISDLPLLLHVCIDLKSILHNFVCSKGIPYTKENPIDIFMLWCYFSMVVDKGILGIVLWCSGLYMVTFHFMMVVCCLYIASDLLMLSMVIGQFLV